MRPMMSDCKHDQRESDQWYFQLQDESPSSTFNLNDRLESFPEPRTFDGTKPDRLESEWHRL